MALGATLKVKMDTSGVTRGLAGMKAKVGRAFGAIRKVGLAAFGAIAAAAAGLFAAAVNAKNFVREVHLMSLQTGMAIDDVLTFQAAMERFGLETSAAADFVSEFQKRISEAAQGEGEAVKGLKKIGLAVSDVTGLDAIDAFEKVVNAIHAIGLNSEDAAFAVDKLFGSQGFRVVALAKDFKKVMAEARVDTAGVASAIGDPQRFERFERSLSRIKLIAREVQLRFVEALPLDRLDEMLENVDLDGFGEKLSEELEEFLANPDKKIIEWATKLGQYIGEGIVQGIIEWAFSAEGLKFLASTINPFGKGNKVISGALEGAADKERKKTPEEIEAEKGRMRIDWEGIEKVWKAPGEWFRTLGTPEGWNPFGNEKGGAIQDLLSEAEETNSHLRRISDGGATFA